MKPYPDYITFAWQRDSDDDYEIVGTLNGETIDDVKLWNGLVEQTLAAFQMTGHDVKAYNREDVYSVIEFGGTDWEPLTVGVK